MADQTIMIIRHSEKPDDLNNGVGASGALDSKSLTPRGWQRAGAWAELFSPAFGTSKLPEPTTIFASAPAGHQETAAGNGGSKSRRPLQTVTPLAEKLEIEINLEFAKGNEVELANALSATPGVTLVCWQHENIFEIANALTPTPSGVPNTWPSTCFNVIFRFDRPDGVSAWTFKQVVPVLLAGDDANHI